MRNNPVRRQVSRRSVLKTIGMLGTAMIVQPWILGGRGVLAANDRLNVAIVGLGTRGTVLAKIAHSAQQNLVALCDVNKGAKGLSVVGELASSAKFFQDFRTMLDQMGNGLDAVLAAVPNHNHFTVGMAAMQHGKHVYVEKPLATTVWEIREMAKACVKHKVRTQLGNQGHSADEMRMAKEWIDAGLIGKVREVHVWTSRGGGGPAKVQTEPVPETLNWDVFLGPAKERDFSPAYLKWHGFWDFGGGPLYDIGCHTLDAPVFALDLKAPAWVAATVSQPPSSNPPSSSIVEYHFAAEGERPEVKLFWYDGGQMPPRPKDLEADRSLEKMADEGGCLFVGEKGSMIVPGMRATTARLIPEARMKEFAGKLPKPTLPRIPGSQGGHMQNWFDAIKEGQASCSDFAESGARLAEIVALGVVAKRAGIERIEWDPAAMRIPNAPNAEALLRPYVRKGWEYTA